jgi:hypothetical protein
MTTVCIVCSSDIIGKNSNAVYCSNRCGNKVRNRRYYKLHPDRIKANNQKQNARFEKRVVTRIKSKCKAKGIPFDLDVTDVIPPDFCPVLGIKLELHNQGSGYHVDSASVDRIDPTKGYTKGNVRVISARANLLKNDATSDELRLVLKDLEEIENEALRMGL